MLDYYTMFGLIDDVPQLPLEELEPEELEQVAGGANSYSGHAGGNKIDNS